MIVLRRKSYSQYDETDALKRMRDSDILALEKKKDPSNANVYKAGAKGAVLGAAVGYGAKMLRPMSKMARLAPGPLAATTVGAGLAAIAASKKNKNEKESNEFFNKRLDYAQKHAKRREKADWKQNMTSREGYTY